MAQRQIPGGQFVNEVGTAQRQIPGGAFVNETVAVGAVTHATSGALTGAGSSVVGAAARVSGAVTHATTGALAGPGSSVVGAAARTRAHPTSGVMTGPGSAVVGSADHVAAGAPHTTTGALVGAGAAVSGTAAHIAKHATTGALTGAGAVLAGTAARVAGAVTHATSGVLVGLGAVIDGAAVGPGNDLDGGDGSVGGGSEKKKRYTYVKRGKKFLLFDTVQQADEFLEAEAKAEAQAAKPVRKKFRKAKPLPVATYEIDAEALKPLLSHYTPTLDVDALIRAQDFEQLLQAKARALRAQDDDEAELLMLTI